MTIQKRGVGMASGRHVTTIGFDADDTLWQNETFYRITQDRFADLLADYTEPDPLHARLLEAERRNLGHYGFGIKGFMLSMIETAIEVTEARVPAPVIAEILAAGQEMLAHPIELLPQVEETVRRLAEDHTLVLITKGDLLDQERKLAQSGLGELFDAVEIVSDKREPVYARAFTAHGDGPERAMMVGNSMKSDVIPALAAGAWGVFVPHGLTWELEHAAAPEGHPRFREIDTLGRVIDLVAEINS
jgi:putative hydrolase of the HAD superfamily